MPQGSVLGPTLFMLYINDICNVSQVLKFVLFAGDNSTLYSDANALNHKSVVNCELDKLHTWFTLNKLSLDVSKTNYVIFGNCKMNCDLDIRIHNNQIARVNKTEFLGVLIEENLDWKNYIPCAKSKISRVVGVMYRASHVLETASLFTLCCLLQKSVVKLMCGVNRFCHTNMLFIDIEY